MTRDKMRFKIIGAYAPYFEVAGFRCGIRFSSNGLHSRLWANGSLNSDSREIKQSPEPFFIDFLRILG